MATKLLAPLIPAGDFPVTEAGFVGVDDERLDDVLAAIQQAQSSVDSQITEMQSQISALGKTIKIKGRVNTVNDLPGTASEGDMYFVGAETAESFEEYVFTAQNKWEHLGSINDIDLSDYVTKTFLSGELLGYAKLSDIPTVPTNYLTGGSQTSKSTADGGKNVYTFTKSDGTTSTLEVLNGTKGSQGIQGIQGVKGDKGDTGDTGPQGPAGTNGTNGKNGTNGTSAVWFTGTAVTGTASSITVTVSGSKAGDMYLNTSTWNVYSATAANTWKYACNIRGAAGQNGSNGTNGKDGTNGVSVSKVEQTTTSSADGGTNVVTVTLSNGTSSTFNVKNGSKGSKGDTGATGPAGQNATTTAVATTSSNGLMAASDKVKLNDVDADTSELNNRYHKNRIKLRTTTAERINGVTLTPQSDGSIICSGTATADVWYTVSSATDMDKETDVGVKYVLTGCPSGGGNNTYLITWTNSGIENASVGTDEKIIVKQSNYTSMLIGIRKGVNANGLVFMPMLRKYGTNNTFVQYIPDVAELYKMIINLQ
ncbi:MAG: collagen-like protein [Oscillospiraceae bacterium]|nr:collagen-like protein [Oscillospiraceae bacterium]